MKYDAACHAVAEAKSVDEAKDIRDKAEAMRAYARQAKNKDLEIDAAEIRMRAERRVGEIMALQRETVGLASGGQPYQATGSEPNPVATLAEAGIDKKLADKARKLAAVPEAEFEGMIGEWRERVGKENERVTTNLLRAGENEVSKRQRVDPPQGLYETVIIDPPWPMEKIEREVRPNQTKPIDYPTMTEAELTDLYIPFAADAHIFMWSTHKFLPMGYRLLAAWGLKYVCLFTWHKPGGFQPYGLPQYNSEFVLYARNGSPKFADTKAFFTCFDAPRREHSRKPDEFYGVIGRVTHGPRIDMFARQSRDGFDTWGNETEKFVA